MLYTKQTLYLHIEIFIWRMMCLITKLHFASHSRNCTNRFFHTFRISDIYELFLFKYLLTFQILTINCLAEYFSNATYLLSFPFKLFSSKANIIHNLVACELHANVTVFFILLAQRPKGYQQLQIDLFNWNFARARVELLFCATILIAEDWFACNQQTVKSRKLKFGLNIRMN